MLQQSARSEGPPQHSEELNDVGIRLNKARPKISVTKTSGARQLLANSPDSCLPWRKTGGFKFNATCTLTEPGPQQRSSMQCSIFGAFGGKVSLSVRW